MENVDVNQSGHVEFDEFLIAAARYAKGSEEDKIRFLFESIG